MNATDTNKLRQLPAVGSTDSTSGDLPAVYLFTPDANATWILWEYDHETREAFGMCDLGMGFPELGYVDVGELIELRGAFGLPVERERYLTTRFDGMRNAGIAIPSFLE